MLRALGTINLLVSLPIAAGAFDSIIPPVFTDYKSLMIIGLFCEVTSAVISLLRAQRVQAGERARRTNLRLSGVLIEPARYERRMPATRDNRVGEGCERG